MSDKSASLRGSPDIQEQPEEDVQQPKNPIIRPQDVKLTENLAKLMQGDLRQVHLHRTLGAAADYDNENTVAMHLQKVFNVLIENCPDKALEKFEEVSYLIRNGHDLSKFLKVDQDRSYKEQANDLAQFIAKTMPLFVKPKAENEDDDAAAETAPVCAIQDLLADEQLFNAAGIGFGQQEMYLLQKSLQRLAASQQCSFLRFFGKIRCTQSDYYVVEATAEAPEAADDNEEEANTGEEKDPNQEEKGTGVNKYTYFVASSPFSTWSRLPDLSPAQIDAARKIKVLFSGDLEHDIICNPFFFGKEKHLLRAQIARITQSSVVVPKGSYKLNEENDREIEEVVAEEESKVEPLPSTLKASTTAAWVHFNASILECNRTLHLDPPEEAPEGFEGDWDPEVAKKEIEAADPFEPRLKSIDLDSKIKMGGKLMQCPWIVRLVGDSQEYVDERGKTVCHGVVVVRSLVWPGSFTLYKNGVQKTIYAGDGIKFTDSLRPFPLAPPVLNLDPAEYGEFILPDIKILTPEEIKQKLEECFDDLWGKYDDNASGAIAVDDLKKLVAEVKGRINEAEAPIDVNEDAFEEAADALDKNDDDKVAKKAVKAMLETKFASL